MRLGSLEIFIACTAVIIVYIEFNGFVTEIIVILEENVIVMRLVMSVGTIVFKICEKIQIIAKVIRYRRVAIPFGLKFHTYF